MHSLRLGGLAVFDLLGTAGLSFLISRYGLHRPDALAFVLVFVILILVAIMLHEAFCVDTRMNSWLFGRPWPPVASGQRSGPRPA